MQNCDRNRDMRSLKMARSDWATERMENPANANVLWPKLVSILRTTEMECEQKTRLSPSFFFSLQTPTRRRSQVNKTRQPDSPPSVSLCGFSRSSMKADR